MMTWQERNAVLEYVQDEVAKCERAAQPMNFAGSETSELARIIARLAMHLAALAKIVAIISIPEEES